MYGQNSLGVQGHCTSVVYVLAFNYLPRDCVHVLVLGIRQLKVSKVFRLVIGCLNLEPKLLCAKFLLMLRLY